MQIIRKILMLLFLTLFSVNALGSDITGNDWVENYGKKNELHYAMQGYLVGYLLGRKNSGEFIKGMIRNGLLGEKGENKGLGLYLIDEFTYQCSNKKETSYNQFFAILDKYIRANPQFWHQGLFTLINSAFNETEFFRCSKEDYK